MIEQKFLYRGDVAPNRPSAGDFQIWKKMEVLDKKREG